jgi:outer membrane protein assembly factor BamB
LEFRMFSDGSLIRALDLTDYGIPTTPVISGALAYVGTSNGYVVAIDLKEGTIPWSVQLVIGAEISVPTIYNDKLYVTATSANRFIYCLNLINDPAAGITAGSTAWSSSLTG